MTEEVFLLQDRIQKIQSMNEKYDLLNNAYISFSGGRDSTVLHYLIDEALPNNQIPRVYINTGIEYKSISSFVEREREIQGFKSFLLESTSRKHFRLSVIRSNQKNIPIYGNVGKKVKNQNG